MSKQSAPWILIIPALELVTALSPGAAFAQGTELRVQSYLEYIYSDIEREIKATGEKSEGDSSYFRQNYDVDLQNQIYPYLRIRGGGHYELIDSSSETDGSTTGYEERARRGFGQVDFTNPLYSAGTAYRYREFEFSPRDFESTNIFREEYSALWRWRPVSFPSIDLDFNHFHTWDEEQTRDLISDLLVLKERYDYRDFHSDYTYTRSDTGDEITDEGALSQVHNAGVQYGTDFLERQVELNTAARLNYEIVEPLGSGVLRLPATSTGAAFYLLDDNDPNTLTYVDAANPLTNVDIGQNGPLNPVAVGLDFGPPTEVDTIHVLPLEDASDPTLASPGEIAAIAGGFVWTVFTSDDQLNWTEVVVTSASYSVFDNRFEIVFLPGVQTAYIKVVTTPVTNASGEIRIARLQAFTTSVSSPGEERETITQTYNLGLRWNVSEDTTATYESFARIRDDAFLDATRTTLTNAVAVRHEFTPIFYGDAKLLRMDTIDTEMLDTTRLTYTTSLGANYLPTLQQRLIYSGTHEEQGRETGHSNSLLLRTNADIYRDWSANLDLGFSAASPLIGPDYTSTSFRLATNVAPHRTVNLTIDYLGSWDTQTEIPSSFNQNAKFQAFWIPVSTLSLFAGISLRDDQRSRQGLSVIQNYSANWTVLPDGTLQLNLAYNQNIDNRGTETRTLSPQIKWRMTRTTLLTLTFDYGKIETETDIRNVKSVHVQFRLFY